MVLQSPRPASTMAGLCMCEAGMQENYQCPPYNWVRKEYKNVINQEFGHVVAIQMLQFCFVLVVFLFFGTATSTCYNNRGSVWDYWHRGGHGFSFLFTHICTVIPDMQTYIRLWKLFAFWLHAHSLTLEHTFLSAYFRVFEWSNIYLHRPHFLSLEILDH